MSDDDTGARAALPIDLPYDEEEIERQIAAGPPATAEEYLLRVRWVLLLPQEM